jgi:hypothetical protein
VSFAKALPVQSVGKKQQDAVFYLTLKAKLDELLL